MMASNDLLKIKQACNLIGIGRTKLYELMGQNKIQAFKLGSITLIPKKSIDEFIKNLPKAKIDPNAYTAQKAHKKIKKHKKEYPANVHTQDILLGRRQIRSFVPASEMTLWRWEKEGQFPRHLKINGRNYWLISEIKEWLQTHKQRRDVGGL